MMITAEYILIKDLDLNLVTAFGDSIPMIMPSGVRHIAIRDGILQYSDGSYTGRVFTAYVSKPTGEEESYSFPTSEFIVEIGRVKK